MPGKTPAIDVVEHYYSHFYSKVHGCGTGGLANNRLQRDLEHTRTGAHYDTVLELGAGDLGHITWASHSFRRYVAADIRTPPTLTGWEPLDGAKLPDRAGYYFAKFDARKIPFADETFDRLVATCLVMHLDEPMDALVEWRRAVRVGGVLDILVPCDPGLLVRAYRTLVSRRRALSLGFNEFDLVNALDHKSPVSSLLVIARHVFTHDTLDVNWYPFRVPSWNLNSHLVLRVRRSGP